MGSRSCRKTKVKMKNYNRNSRRHAGPNAKPIRKFVTVTSEECQGNPEKMVRRFIKKVKSDGLLEEVRSRTHFIKPSEVKRMKNRDTKRLIQKLKVFSQKFFFDTINIDFLILNQKF